MNGFCKPGMYTRVNGNDDRQILLLRHLNRMPILHKEVFLGYLKSIKEENQTTII